MASAALGCLTFGILSALTLVLFASTDAAVAQVPTTLPTSAPTTEPPPPTSSPSTTSKPTTTQQPTQTTQAPADDEPDEDSTATSEGSPTSARPPATGAGGDEAEVPAADPNLPDAIRLGGEEDALITSSASGRLPAIFPWLGLIGTFAFIALVAAQWALTNPARRGSRTL